MRAAAARGDRRAAWSSAASRGTSTTLVSRAGRGQPGRPAAPLPDQERPGRRRRRAPHRGARRRAGGRGRGRCRPGRGAPARCCRCSPTTSPRRSSPPRSSSGSPPAPTRRCSRRSRRWSSGSAARRTGSPSSCSAPTSRGPASASWCRPPSTWSAASAWPTRSPTTPAGARRILDQWARTLDARSGGAAMSDLLDEPARRPQGRGRPAPARPSPASTRTAGARRPRPPAGTSPPRSPTCSGPTRSPSLAATDKAAWDALVLRGDRRPGRASSTRPPARSRRLRAAGAARPLGRGARRRWRRPCATCPTGEKMPWFGPPMSPPRWPPPGSWRPGRTRSTCYEALGVEPEPTDRIRHVAHLGVRTRNFAFSVHELDAAGRGVPGRADRAVRRGLDLGPGGRRPDGDRVGVRLLPAGHPARPPRRHRPGRRRRRRRALARHRAGVRRPARRRAGAAT